mgnify:FL=1
MFFLAWFFGVLGLVLYWFVVFEYLGDIRLALSRVESSSEPVLAEES